MDPLNEHYPSNIHDDNYRPNDHEIENVVKELLHNSQRIDARDISVSVDQMNVTLRGTVQSQFERDYAVAVTKLVHGVGNIESEIIVKRNEGILPTDIGRKTH